jgi:hypothetical protein
MPKIVVSLNGQIQKEIDLDKSRWNIGRRPTNDLVLDHLAVSGRHAAVDISIEGVYLLDLGSTNGTTVNGQPVKKHLLQNNDLIEVGKYQLKFKMDSEKPILHANGKLKIISGSNAGKEMSLNKQKTTLGSPGILVVSIAKELHQYTIVFVEGKLFPKINEQEIDARPHTLKNGDVIDLSGTKMEFTLINTV